jgi:DNA-binding transcriptional ArsR family regulator
VSVSDEEPYSTIFASLNHPVRRKILRMLSQKSMSFSEMLEALGVSSSFLTYHIENLGELVSKTDGGKYRLSSFGEAAITTMSKVEDIPLTVRQQQTKSGKVVGRSVAIALGIVGILLIACLGGVTAYYTMAIHDKENELNSTNSTIDQLNTKVTDLQNQTAFDNVTMTSLQFQIDLLQFQIAELEKNASADNATITNLLGQVNLLRNWSSSITNMIMSDPSSWVNRTVIVEGDLTGIFVLPAFQSSPWYNKLVNGNQSIGVSFDANVRFVNSSTITFEQIFGDYGLARIYGVVEKGIFCDSWFGDSVTYYIEAEIVELLGNPVQYPPPVIVTVYP